MEQRAFCPSVDEGADDGRIRAVVERRVLVQLDVRVLGVAPAPERSILPSADPHCKRVGVFAALGTALCHGDRGGVEVVAAPAGAAHPDMRGVVFTVADRCEVVEHGPARPIARKAIGGIAPSRVLPATARTCCVEVYLRARHGWPCHRWRRGLTADERAAWLRQTTVAAQRAVLDEVAPARWLWAVDARAVRLRRWAQRGRRCRRWRCPKQRRRRGCRLTARHGTTRLHRAAVGAGGAGGDRAALLRGGAVDLRAVSWWRRRWRCWRREWRIVFARDDATRVQQASILRQQIARRVHTPVRRIGAERLVAHRSARRHPARVQRAPVGAQCVVGHELAARGRVGAHDRWAVLRRWCWRRSRCRRELRRRRRCRLSARHNAARLHRAAVGANSAWREYAAVLRGGAVHIPAVRRRRRHRRRDGFGVAVNDATGMHRAAMLVHEVAILNQAAWTRVRTHNRIAVLGSRGRRRCQRGCWWRRCRLRRARDDTAWVEQAAVAALGVVGHKRATG